MSDDERTAHLVGLRARQQAMDTARVSAPDALSRLPHDAACRCQQCCPADARGEAPVSPAMAREIRGMVAYYEYHAHDGCSWDWHSAAEDNREQWRKVADEVLSVTAKARPADTPDLRTLLERAWNYTIHADDCKHVRTSCTCGLAELNDQITAALASGPPPAEPSEDVDQLLAERQRFAEDLAQMDGSRADRLAWKRAAEAIFQVRTHIATKRFVAASPAGPGPSEREPANDRIRAAAATVVRAWLGGDFGRIFPLAQKTLLELQAALGSSPAGAPEPKTET